MERTTCPNYHLSHWKAILQFAILAYYRLCVVSSTSWIYPCSYYNWSGKRWRVSPWTCLSPPGCPYSISSIPQVPQQTLGWERYKLKGWAKPQRGRKEEVMPNLLCCSLREPSSQEKQPPAPAESPTCRAGRVLAGRQWWRKAQPGPHGWRSPSAAEPPASLTSPSHTWVMPLNLCSTRLDSQCQEIKNQSALLCCQCQGN